MHGYHFRAVQFEIDGDVISSKNNFFIALVVGGGGETTRGAIMNLWYYYSNIKTSIKQFKGMRNFGIPPFMKC